MEFDELSRKVIGCALEVHRNLGPSLWSQHIVNAWRVNLHMLGFHSRWSFHCRLATKGMLLDCGYRIDLLVSGDLIVEIKCIETLLPIHQAQILTYMRLSKILVGLMINFNVTKLQNGIQRFVL